MSEVIIVTVVILALAGLAGMRETWKETYKRPCPYKKGRLPSVSAKKTLVLAPGQAS